MQKNKFKYMVRMLYENTKMELRTMEYGNRNEFIISGGQINIAEGFGRINAVQNNRGVIQSNNVKEASQGDKIEVFLSYCWSDDIVANEIYDYLKSNIYIELHRDKIDIGTWGSIKEYMQSIPQMDYIILLISDSYLKSANCMYEVLEVLRDRNYRNKIFPAVINTSIYNPITRANYVKYWQQQYDELNESLQGIGLQNIGKLGEDLKRRQNIASNMADFLDVISDMNNPEIADIKIVIGEKLSKFKKIQASNIQNEASAKIDYLSELNIPKKSFQTEPTDLEINQFIAESFKMIIELLSKVAEQCQNENIGIYTQIEQVDTRTTIFKFYRNGNLIRGLKLFLSSMHGNRENIGISDNTMSLGGSTSWNGMYEAKVADGELKLYATFSLMNSGEAMTIEEVVGHIWNNYIQVYLER